MDIPACTSASDTTPPPPSYNEIDEFPLCEVIPALPPPSYTSDTAPPAYREAQNAQEISQYPKGSGANPYPILNVPPQTAVAMHSDIFEEIPLNTMRSVSNPDPPARVMHPEQNNFQQIPQNPKRRTGTYPDPMPNVQTAMFMHTEQVMMQQMTRSTVNPQVIMVQPQQIIVLDDTPVSIVCQYCNKRIRTKVTYKPGSAAWGMCICISLFGLICGFCLIPFCVNGFQDAHHSCPNCNKHLGIYKRR